MWCTVLLWFLLFLEGAEGVTAVSVASTFCFGFLIIFLRAVIL